MGFSRIDSFLSSMSLVVNSVVYIFINFPTHRNETVKKYDAMFLVALYVDNNGF